MQKVDVRFGKWIETGFSLYKTNFGTLVLASAAERPTLLAYLPETSVVVLAADWIEASYEEAWESIRAMPGGVPRSVNFITGPSRTADIAQKLELGAHGPRRLLVLIVEYLEA